MEKGPVGRAGEGSGAVDTALERPSRTQRRHRPGMKKTGKRKPYFKPLFKVNASKSEDVEKQSQLMLENHKKLTSSTTTTTTKDGLRRNHAKPKKNQYVLVHSFLDDNDVENAEERAGSKTHGHHLHHHHHHPFDMDIGFNRSVTSIKRSSSCKSYASTDCADQDVPVASSSMANSASNGLTNLFKKSLKRNSTQEDSNGNNSGVNASSDGLVSVNNSMDCLAFDPFVTTAAATPVAPSSTPMDTYQQQTQAVSEPDVVEKQHRPSGFRKFYTRNKAKSKSKLMGRSKPIAAEPEIHVVEHSNSTVKPITPVQSSQPTFPSQTYDYFSIGSNTIAKSTRNRSTSSSSSFLRQQQQQQQQLQLQQPYLADDSFLYTPSTMATPIDTPLGTPFESYEDVVTPSRTPTTMDDESNLEVCSINTSSTKRFKALKRSSSIMSLNSSLSMQLATPMTTTQGGTPIPASPLVSSISNPGTSRSALNIGTTVYPSITTPAVGTRARILSCSSNVSIGHPHHVQKSPSNSNINAKVVVQQQQQQQQQQQHQSYQQQQQPFLVKSKSLTPQPQLQPQMQSMIPSQHLPMQISPIASFPPQHKSSPVMTHPPNQLPFVRSPVASSGDVPTIGRNMPPVKGSINLDSYLYYMDESKARAQNPHEVPSSDPSMMLNFSTDRPIPPTRPLPPAQATSRLQPQQFQHPQQLPPHLYHQPSSHTHPFILQHPPHHVHPQQMPQQAPQPPHTVDPVPNRLQDLIDQQQQQILRQQLHHNDPQVMPNLQILEELDSQLNQLGELSELNGNSKDSSSNPVETFDGMENLDDSKIVDSLLNEELDQLINITRLEALAREIEEFGTPAGASVVLPRQSRGPGDYPGYPVYHP